MLMIQRINDLSPLVAIGLLALLFTLETFVPYLTRIENRSRHTRRNAVIMVIAIVINGACGAWLVWWIGQLDQHQFGLMRWLGVPPAWNAALGVLLIDLTDYPFHVLTHTVPLLWRYHRVHHSDHELDSTSSIRFHPFEMLVQTAWQTVTLALLGVGFTGLAIFSALLVILVVIQHANVRYPRWFESTVGAVFVTARWHRVHHSDDQQYTDAHYADVFTFWDRLFGTARQVDETTLRWGLKEFRDDRHHTVWGILSMPFRR
jgi:sterol desaturase/sphingolipid hydroxylase (fatty acid hydroxylase superfamily)